MDAIANSAVKMSAVVLLATGFAIGGCNSGKDKPQKIEFRGERTLLPEFEEDTGFVPEDSPGQLRAVAKADGTIRAQATGKTRGESLEPASDSGRLKTGGGLTLDIFGRVDTDQFDWEGNLKSFGYEMGEAETSFDPFLLEGETTVTNELPAEELGEVPIPSIPNATAIISVEGGTLETTFQGTCAKARDGLGQYVGETVTSGTIELSGTIKIGNPIGDDKKFGPFPIPVDVPDISADLDLGTYSLQSGEPVEETSVCGGSGNGGGDAGDAALSEVGVDANTDTGLPYDDSGSSDVSDTSDLEGDTTDTGSDADTDSSISCSTEGDCQDGYMCVGGECVACVDDSDCRPGEICVDGSCEG